MAPADLFRLRALIDELISQSGEWPDPFRVVEIHENVIMFTKTVFRCEPRIEGERDAEFGDRKFVVHVTASGSVDELWQLSESWHRGIIDVAKEMSNVYVLSPIPE